MSASEPHGTKGSRRARAFGLGGAIGVLGGLIGLGGAEFRLPVLHGLFRFPIHQAVRFNLLISLATVVVSLAARLALASFPALGPLAGEILAVAAGAVAAAWFGTGLLGRLSEHSLTLLISGLLAGIAGLLLVEAVLPVGFSFGLPDTVPLRIAIGIAAGAAIGMVSSLLGVAGGELIIPTFIFVFGTDVKTAGTASLIISLPTVLVGVVRYWRQGAYRSRGPLVDVAAPMAAGSAAGAILGAGLVGILPAGLLKLVLGLILAVSAMKMLAARTQKAAVPPLRPQDR